MKTVNYTEEQIKQIVEQYVAGITVEDIAAGLGKSVKSIVAKLAREGVYKAKTKVASARVTKADLVAQIANTLQLDPKSLESLTKASHEALEALSNKVMFNG